MILLLGDILFLYYFQLYIPLISSSKSSGHFNVFVGDLSPEVTDATLFACFSVYTTCSWVPRCFFSPFITFFWVTGIGIFFLMVNIVVLVSGEKLKNDRWYGGLTSERVTQSCKTLWFLELTFPSSLLLSAVMLGLCGITKLVAQKDMVLFLSVIIRYCLFCTLEFTGETNQWTEEIMNIFLKDHYLRSQFIFHV